MVMHVQWFCIKNNEMCIHYQFSLKMIPQITVSAKWGIFASVNLTSIRHIANINFLALASLFMEIIARTWIKLGVFYLLYSPMLLCLYNSNCFPISHVWLWSITALMNISVSISDILMTSPELLTLVSEVSKHSLILYCSP